MKTYNIQEYTKRMAHKCVIVIYAKQHVTQGMQQPNHKLHYLLPPTGHLIMKSVMHVFSVFLAVGPNGFVTYGLYSWQ